MEQFLNTIIFTTMVIGLLLLIKQNKKQKHDARSWIFASLALVLIPFGLVWGVTSFYEGEPQAGWVGIFAFSGLGVVFGFLALKNMFPEQMTNFRLTISSEKLGYRITIVTLLVIAGLAMPFGYIIHHTVNHFSERENIEYAINENILSDEAMPEFIKKTLAYQKLYAEHPGTLKGRLMQGMIAGIDSEGFNHLTDVMMPEEERRELLHNIASNVESWMDSDQDYPEMVLHPAIYINRAHNNTTFLATWFYQNMNMPPMHDTMVQKFRKGLYSTNVEDYLGTPPADLKDSLIQPFANAIQLQLDSVEVPESISLGEKMAEHVSVEELTEKKHMIGKFPAMGATAYYLIIALFLVAVALIFVAKLNWIKWLSWLCLLFGLRMSFCVSMFGNTDGLMWMITDKLANEVPAPALAAINFILPDHINLFGSTFFSIMLVALSTGFIGLLFSYKSSLTSLIKHGKQKD